MENGAHGMKKILAVTMAAMLLVCGCDVIPPSQKQTMEFVSQALSTDWGYSVLVFSLEINHHKYIFWERNGDKCGLVHDESCGCKTDPLFNVHNQPLFD